MKTQYDYGGHLMFMIGQSYKPEEEGFFRGIDEIIGANGMHYLNSNNCTLRELFFDLVYNGIIYGVMIGKRLERRRNRDNREIMEILKKQCKQLAAAKNRDDFMEREMQVAATAMALAGYELDTLTGKYNRKTAAISK